MKSSNSFLIEICFLIHKYIWKIKKVRLIIFFSCLNIGMSKYLLHKCGLCNMKITSKLKNNNFDIKKEILFLFLYTLFYKISKPISNIYICQAKYIVSITSKLDNYKSFLAMNSFFFYNDFKFIDPLNIIIQKSNAVEQIVGSVSTYIIPQLISIFLTFVYTFKIFGYRESLILLTFVFFYFYITVLIQNYRNLLRKESSFLFDKCDDFICESIDNHNIIQVNQSINFELDRYRIFCKDASNKELQFEKMLYYLEILQFTIWNIAKFSIISYLTFSIKTFNIDLFIYFLTTMNGFGDNLSNLTQIYRKLCINFILYKKYSLFHPPTLNFLFLPNIFRSIEFRNISIKYGSKLILYPTTFKLLFGSKFAITGNNGCGKSSFLHNLLGYGPSTPDLFIDDVLVGNGQLDFNNISFISQKTILFNNTVLYNIKYGNFSLSNDVVFKYAEFFGIHHVFSSMKNGYNTICGPSGNLISPGEKQLIIFLREYLKFKSFFFLDEPFSNVHPEIEKNIFDKLLLNDDLTIIAVVHNTEILNLFNSVFNLNDGHLIKL